MPMPMSPRELEERALGVVFARRRLREHRGGDHPFGEVVDALEVRPAAAPRSDRTRTGTRARAWCCSSPTTAPSDRLRSRARRPRAVRARAPSRRRLRRTGLIAERVSPARSTCLCPPWHAPCATAAGDATRSERATPCGPSTRRARCRRPCPVSRSRRCAPSRAHSGSSCDRTITFTESICTTPTAAKRRRT